MIGKHNTWDFTVVNLSCFLFPFWQNNLHFLYKISQYLIMAVSFFVFKDRQETLAKTAEEWHVAKAQLARWDLNWGLSCFCILIQSDSRFPLAAFLFVHLNWPCLLRFLNLSQLLLLLYCTITSKQEQPYATFEKMKCGMTNIIFISC